MGAILKVIGAIVVAVILLGLLVDSGNDDAVSDYVAEQLTDTYVDDVIDEPEPEPEENVTWEWVEDPQCDSSGARCWQIKVYSDTGCPDGLYAELNVLDASDTTIDYTNDSLGVLPPGRSAILTFDYYGDGAKSGEIAKVSCY